MSAKSAPALRVEHLSMRFGGLVAVDDLSFSAARGDITDRNGVALARTIDAWSIGVHPSRLIGDKRQLAQRLGALMPERSAAHYLGLLNSQSSYVYLSRRALPEMVASVNALGEPGIVFNREPERLYPQTAMAGHVLGWTDMEGHGVTGMERVLDARLIDPAQRGRPIALSIDSRVQALMESELAEAVTSMNAEGGTGIVLDVATGEVIAMASAPTFNPNAAGRSDASALYNRATMGVYELGSTFKLITVAAAMEAGVITSMNQRWDASAPISIGRYQIHDDRGHEMNRPLTVPELIVHSSNIATARVADAHCHGASPVTRDPNPLLDDAEAVVSAGAILRASGTPVVGFPYFAARNADRRMRTQVAMRTGREIATNPRPAQDVPRAFRGNRGRFRRLSSGTSIAPGLGAGGAWATGRDLR